MDGRGNYDYGIAAIGVLLGLGMLVMVLLHR
jgi:hypothetical protein